MKSFYNFTSSLKQKYPNLSLYNSALTHEINYDQIILNNIYESKIKYKKIKDTILTNQEVRDYLLVNTYCYKIYNSNNKYISNILNDLVVVFLKKECTVLEVIHLIRLLPFMGLTNHHIANSLYCYLTEIKPYYYQVIKLCNT